jgi:hypothetical protein
VTHERALSLADFFGGKTPVGALIGLLERKFAGAYSAQVHYLYASVTAVYLPFFVLGGVLTRLARLD